MSSLILFCHLDARTTRQYVYRRLPFKTFCFRPPPPFTTVLVEISSRTGLPGLHELHPIYHLSLAASATAMAIIEPLAVAHSSRDSRPRRKEKGKERAHHQHADDHLASSTAGPSKPSRRASAAGPSWDCIPIARSEVSSIPPVWSKDGRWVECWLPTDLQVLLHCCQHFYLCPFLYGVKL